MFTICVLLETLLLGLVRALPSFAQDQNSFPSLHHWDFLAVGQDLKVEGPFDVAIETTVSGCV